MKPRNKAIKCQQGQALVLMLAVIVVAWVGLTWVVQLSERSQRQTHIQQVADYATQAFAVVAARDLNFKAVTNRAMLVNSVAIAQLVGLHAYLEMLSRTSQNAALVTSWVPYANAAMAQVARALHTVQRSYTTAASGLIQLHQLTIQLLSHAQTLFHAAASVTALRTSQHVVTTADNSLELVLFNHATLPQFAYVWLGYQHRQSDISDFITLAQRSRDPFSQARSYRWFSVSPGLVNARLEKWGGSEISHQFTRHIHWQAIDIATLRVRLGPFRSFTVPLGWGGASAGLRPPFVTTPARDAFGGAYHARRSLSRQSAAQATVLTNSMPAPLYYSVDSDRRLPQITLAVREKDSEYKAYAVSRAGLHFHRPNLLWPRRDAWYERANLYNAVWRAQPESISIAEQWILEQQL
ncbi:hypothetical protein [Aliidiomarina maris]|uniref:Flp pilus-assembly TadE/G-like protein n=1 Tax=Aliidiomarina maris TaxID=531312 RepID=A0A327WPF0_9GAMM|nr:hypothetical protein [Aliidiomarina maris]RAJ93681.1 hypothetical protein B0I24_11639 [Aliidiomarina maris]RUO19398.1 hypothetical protein CWE07_13020 [Aliidiomarina maris]